MRTWTVTVEYDGIQNRYQLDGGYYPNLTLYRGFTYKFDQSNSTNDTHQLAFSATQDGTHNSGTRYTSGYTYIGTAGNDGAHAILKVPQDAPNTLYYYCINHSGMAGDSSITVETLESGSSGTSGSTGSAGKEV